MTFAGFAAVIVMILYMLGFMRSGHVNNVVGCVMVILLTVALLFGLFVAFLLATL